MRGDASQFQLVGICPVLRVEYDNIIRPTSRKYAQGTACSVAIPIRILMVSLSWHCCPPLASCSSAWRDHRSGQRHTRNELGVHEKGLQWIDYAVVDSARGNSGEKRVCAADGADGARVLGIRL